MVRNETVSSLGNRIVEDEREEINEANFSTNLMSRFFNNIGNQNNSSSNFQGFQLMNLRAKTSLLNYDSIDGKLEGLDNKHLDYNLITDRSEQSAKYLLHNACSRGNVDTVRFFLEQPENSLSVNQLNNLKMTPLDCAIENRKLEIIKLLLKNDIVNINIGGSKQRSSLNLAIQIGNYPAICEILKSEKMIDFGITDDYGNN
jgi:hypothetical protein